MNIHVITSSFCRSTHAKFFILSVTSRPDFQLAMALSVRSHTMTWYKDFDNVHRNHNVTHFQSCQASSIILPLFTFSLLTRRCSHQLADPFFVCASDIITATISSPPYLITTLRILI